MIQKKTDIGNRIREYSKYLNLSLIKFADLLDISNQNLAYYVNNRSKPCSDLLIKFHNLGCNIVWLLTGEGSMLRSSNELSAAEIEQLKANYEAEITSLRKENETLSIKIDTLQEMIDRIINKNI